MKYAPSTANQRLVSNLVISLDQWRPSVLIPCKHCSLARRNKPHSDVLTPGLLNFLTQHIREIGTLQVSDSKVSQITKSSFIKLRDQNGLKPFWSCIPNPRLPRAVVRRKIFSDEFSNLLVSIYLQNN